VATVRIITDSGCDIPDDIAARLGIDIVYLSIRFGEDEFGEENRLSPDEFWAKCKASPTLPETAAPSPGAFQAAYNEALEAGCSGVLVITLSAKLSATHQSATLAAETMAGRLDVRVVDSEAASMAQGLLAIDVAEAALEGRTLDELEALALDLRSRVGVVATIDTLEHLIKGGRVGGAKALIGQVLSIKPIIELRDGVVAEAGRQRTRTKALAAIAQVVKDHAPLHRVALLHGACHDREVLEDLLSGIVSDVPIVVADIGPVVGTHGGPGIIGVAWIGKESPHH
jgi:DegV family protein with EDD domain